MIKQTQLLLLMFLFSLIEHHVVAFCPIARTPSRHLIKISAGDGFAKEQTTPDEETINKDASKKKKPKGDSIRSATGIRPSLHPVTINCIAEALLMRSKQTQETTIDTASPNAEPLQIAITAGGIAMNAIEQRKAAAETDETTDVFSMEESNAISGRVVGVVMRMRELEHTLRVRVNAAEWIFDYGEEMSFGLLRKECERAREGAETADYLTEELEKELAENIKINPLLRMNRAECLLALFLETVEKPKLEMIGEDVAGGSGIDFIDVDRLEVLLK